MSACCSAVLPSANFFVIGDGENKHQIIYVEDLIDSFSMAAEKESALGEIFVAAGQEIGAPMTWSIHWPMFCQ